MCSPIKIVYPFDSRRIIDALGRSDHADYLRRYLGKLGAKTCIIEESYIDKDFTIDFQKFYCRSFKKPERETTRIHFFSKGFSDSEFVGLLEKIDSEAINNLKKAYLGFVVVRPIPDIANEPLVGRTLVETYPSEEDGKIRFFVKGKYRLSLFGIPLEIESLPFQAKDRGVSACATVALWAALHPLKELFELPGHSPAEITEMATSFPSSYRKFPSAGLTSEQMINYINLLGLDVEIIKPKDNDAIQAVVKAYLHAGLPILASLKLYKIAGSDTKQVRAELPDKRHAVVISGYQMTKEDRSIKELYIHDDVVGPFCRVEPDGNLLNWKYEWYDRGYRVELEDLRVPIYPKVRTTFWPIYDEYLDQMKKLNMKIESHLNEKLGRSASIPDDRKRSIMEDISSQYKFELLLTSNRDYKKFLLYSNIKNKLDVLTIPLPRFLWVMRLYFKFDPIMDFIFDSTSIYAEKLAYADFQSPNALFKGD